MLTHSTKKLSTGFVGFAETEQLHVAKILFHVLTCLRVALKQMEPMKKKIKKKKTFLLQRIFNL